MTAKLLLFFGFVVSMLLMSLNYKKKKKRLLFLGDSITGQGAKSGGYIKHFSRLFQSEAFDSYDKFEIIASGISGNKVTDVYERLDKDVLWNGADIVVIFIGINDIWHKNKPGGAGTDASEFEKVYEAIIGKLQEAEIKVVLCTLTVIAEKNNYLNDQDEDIETYNQIVLKLATNFDLPLIDLREAFLAYNLENNLEEKELGILTTDGVHLNEKGNQLVAVEMWKVIQAML